MAVAMRLRKRGLPSADRVKYRSWGGSLIGSGSRGSFVVLLNGSNSSDIPRLPVLDPISSAHFFPCPCDGHVKIYLEGCGTTTEVDDDVAHGVLNFTEVKLPATTDPLLHLEKGMGQFADLLDYAHELHHGGAMLFGKVPRAPLVGRGLDVFNAHVAPCLPSPLRSSGRRLSAVPAGRTAQVC